MSAESPHVPIPDFLIPQPPLTLDSATSVAFDQLYDGAVAGDGMVDYRLAAPRWQFIAHVIETRGALVHGSGNPTITRFEPRQPNDSTEFGNQRAVYAASAALWAMYFAILDRVNHPMLMINSAVQFQTGRGLSEPHYFFSISEPAHAARAFARGMIYFLPRDTFLRQPPIVARGLETHFAQWASLEPVVPLARIGVGPEDFPLLDAIRGHDDADTIAKISADPDGFPWLA